MKFLLHCCLCLFAFSAYSQSDSGIYTYIKIQFKHGSEPKKGYEKTEKKSLGGMMGGHVMTQMGDSIFDFAYTKYELHLYPNKRKPIGKFRVYSVVTFKSWFGRDKVTTIYIPATKKQYDTLKLLYHRYIQHCPYDYAFFGMRCTSTTHKLLADAGIMPKASDSECIRDSFYPKQLRERLLKIAKVKKWKVELQMPSNTHRNWEG